jgi:hypothetical protein
VDDLVVAALQEGGIDRAERLHALGRHPGGKGHRVLFGNADIKGAGWGTLANLSTPVPPGIAAVIATILSSCVASCASVSPNTVV